MNIENLDLSTWTKNAAIDAGYKTTRQLHDAIMSGVLVPGKVKNIGKKHFKELCDIVGIEQSMLRPKKPNTHQCPHCGMLITVRIFKYKNSGQAI